MLNACENIPEISVVIQNCMSACKIGKMHFTKAIVRHFKYIDSLKVSEQEKM